MKTGTRSVATQTARLNSMLTHISRHMTHIMLTQIHRSHRVATTAPRSPHRSSPGCSSRSRARRELGSAAAVAVAPPTAPPPAAPAAAAPVPLATATGVTHRGLMVHVWPFMLTRRSPSPYTLVIWPVLPRHCRVAWTLARCGIQTDRLGRDSL